ncbi:hypothetical protein DMENIID0001_134110 [Sergentomyia squamirostris]
MLTESSADLSSDHFPVILWLSNRAVEKPKPDRLHRGKISWTSFANDLNKNIPTNVSLKTGEELDYAVEDLNMAICNSLSVSTRPCIENTGTHESINYPKFIREKIAERRNLRKQWQRSRLPGDKTKFNKAAKSLKQILLDYKNDGIQDY